MIIIDFQEGIQRQRGRIEGLEEKASRRLARTLEKVAQGRGRRPPANVFGCQAAPLMDG